MNQGTDEAIPSDLQVAHRTPINLTADGQIQAIPVNADNAKHHMVLVINRAGGLAVLGGLDLRQLLKPAPGEQGAAEMVEILRLVAQVDVAGIDDDNVNATERLHGAIREYVSMKRQAELQARAELASRRGGADGAQLAEADAAFRALGDVLPEYVGAAQALAQIRGVLERTLRRTPDPARSTAQLALEVEAMVQRLGTGEARQPESDVELHDRLVRERAPSSDGQIIAAVKLALGEVDEDRRLPGGHVDAHHHQLAGPELPLRVGGGDCLLEPLLLLHTHQGFLRVVFHLRLVALGTQIGDDEFHAAHRKRVIDRRIHRRIVKGIMRHILIVDAACRDVRLGLLARVVPAVIVVVPHVDQDRKSVV